MEIRPFRGWRYSTPPDGDISKFIAPPYDLLNRRDKDELLLRSDKNIVAVDLPHAPGYDLGPDEEYQQAAAILDDWRCSRVLDLEPVPALYAYSQTFIWAGKDYTRRGMICGVRIDESNREIIGHEQTLPGPKADRLRLTEYTRTQVSPILGFYDDPQSTVGSLLWDSAEGPPAARARLHEVTEEIWAVTNEGVIREIASVLRGVPVFIADGHHRYATALQYAGALRDAGSSDENHEANFVMFCLVPRDDPGLLVLPTHRIVSGLRDGFAIADLIKSLSQFSWRRCSVDGVDLRDADEFLHKYGPGAMAFIAADPAEIWIGKLEQREAMESLAAEQLPAWRNLDVAILHKLVIEQSLEPWRTERTSVDYTPDGRSVLAACQSGRGQLGICLQSTPLESVVEIALAGSAMPHKSTYFYPKLATGMVLKPLE